MKENNMTGELLRLGNGLKFAVLKQLVYKNVNYLYVIRVTDDEKETMDQYDILEEVIQDGKSYLQTVTDPKLRIKIAKFFMKAMDEEEK